MAKKKAKDTGGQELYYIDADGKKQDSELHDEMLDNPEAEALSLEYSRALVRSYGFSEDEVELLYGKP